jgi:hypothetical protein
VTPREETIGRKESICSSNFDLGETWLLFAKELLLMIFAELAKVKGDISSTDKTVKAEANL